MSDWQPIMMKNLTSGWIILRVNKFKFTFATVFDNIEKVGIESNQRHS